MDRPLLREQAPAEYFKELVDSALVRSTSRRATSPCNYLVNLLCQFLYARRVTVRSGCRWPFVGAVRCRPEGRSSGLVSELFSLFMLGSLTASSAA